MTDWSVTVHTESRAIRTTEGPSRMTCRERRRSAAGALARGRPRRNLLAVSIGDARGSAARRDLFSGTGLSTGPGRSADGTRRSRARRSGCVRSSPGRSDLFLIRSSRAGAVLPVPRSEGVQAVRE